jgi:hypothetical protein
MSVHGFCTCVFKPLVPRSAAAARMEFRGGEGRKTLTDTVPPTGVDQESPDPISGGGYRSPFVHANCCCCCFWCRNACCCLRHGGCCRMERAACGRNWHRLGCGCSSGLIVVDIGRARTRPERPFARANGDAPDRSVVLANLSPPPPAAAGTFERPPPSKFAPVCSAENSRNCSRPPLCAAPGPWNPLYRARIFCRIRAAVSSATAALRVVVVALGIWAAFGGRKPRGGWRLKTNSSIHFLLLLLLDSFRCGGVRRRRPTKDPSIHPSQNETLPALAPAL